MIARPALILGCLLLASCATSEPGRRGPQREGPGVRARLFISPSGEPFRGEPGRPPLAAWFTRADRDHDGALTREEFRADAEAFFQRLDANNDGAIDLDETGVYERVIAPEILGEGSGERMGRPGGGGMRGRGRGRGGPPARGGGGMDFDGMLRGAARFGLLNEAQPVRIADANYDLKVDRAEWRAATDRRFKQLDKNGDGVLHLAELQSVADMRGGGGGHRRRPGGEP